MQEIYDMIKEKLLSLKEPERRVWLVFIALFLLLQSVNMGAAFPDYSGWDSFGFPLSYFQCSSEHEYSYFNAINMFLDMLIIFIIAKVILFGYSQLTKYRIVK